MASLLFVRGMDDIMPAVEAASEFLAYQQQQPRGSQQSDDLLAIWIDRDLDAALPAWSIPSLHSSSERPVTTTGAGLLLPVFGVRMPPRASPPALPISKLGTPALSERLGSSTTDIKARSYRQNMQQD